MVGEGKGKNNLFLNSMVYLNHLMDCEEVLGKKQKILKEKHLILIIPSLRSMGEWQGFP